jgi:hypothetical protein
MSNQRNEVKKEILRLNLQEPQHPTDSYFIKANPDLLQQYISDSRLVKRLEQKATPRYFQRLKLFKL